jgi:hypothetical protein
MKDSSFHHFKSFCVPNFSINEYEIMIEIMIIVENDENLSENLRIACCYLYRN